MKKQLLLILMILVPFVAIAYDTSYDGIYYNYTHSGTVYTAQVTYLNNTNNHSAYIGNVVIPSEIPYDGGRSVTSIGDEAFAQCSDLTSITIPNSVTTIGSYAFRGCSGLTSLNIPNSVTSIGNNAFIGCSGLTSVFIPNSVTSISSETFYACTGLTSVTIPNSVTSIGNMSFCECSGLTSVTIGNGVTSIGDWAFWKCSKLTSVNIGNNVTSIGKAAFAACSNLPSITIPNNVTSIGSSAFAGCSSLGSVIISNSVTSIESSTFEGCTGLTTITIPQSVTSIGDDAFAGCSNLTSVTMMNSKPLVIGNNDPFPLRQNITLYVPAGSKAAYEAADYWKEFKEIIIKNDAGTEGDENDEGSEGDEGNDNNLQWVLVKSDFDKSVPIKKIRVLNKAVSTSNYCCIFFSTTPNDNTTNDTQYSINFYTLRIADNAAVASGVLIKDCTDVGDGWYEYEFKQTVYFSHYQTNCPKDQVKATIIVENKPIISFADDNVKSLCVANWDTDGDGELSEAEAAAVTSLNDVFKGNNEIVSFTELAYFTGLNSINDEAFWKCKNLADIVIPDNVKKIGSKAFLDCYKLAALSLSASVTEIGWAAFSGCYSLTAITIADDNPKFDSRDNCNAIIETATNKLVRGCQNTIIPASVTSIDGYAFEGCQTLKTISIPESVTSIGDCAFAGCNMLESANIPNGVTVIGGSLFRYCEKLASINIPDGVTKIGIFAFDGCNSLTSISLPSSVETIEPMAFYCSNLTSVTVGMITPIALTDGNDFGNHANATLHVPAGCKAAYETADVWKEFKEIVEPPKCAMPTISLVGGKLHFECDTEDVEYHYDFTSASGNGTGNDVAISSTYMVKVYASKEGYTDSDVATANVNVAGLKGDANSDGEVDIADAVHIVNYVVGKIDQLAPRKDMDQADPE